MEPAGGGAEDLIALLHVAAKSVAGSLILLRPFFFGLDEGSHRYGSNSRQQEPN